MDENGPRPAFAGAVVLCIGGALLVVGVGFLMFAMAEWLRLGAWPDYPLSRLLAEMGAPYPQAGFAQGAVDWLLSIGACTSFLAAGALLSLLGWLMLARHDRRRRFDDMAQLG